MHSEPDEAIMAPPEETKTVHSVCKIGACEPFCGLELQVNGNKIVGLRPDKRASDL